MKLRVYDSDSARVKLMHMHMLKGGCEVVAGGGYLSCGLIDSLSVVNHFVQKSRQQPDVGVPALAPSSYVRDRECPFHQ